MGAGDIAQVTAIEVEVTADPWNSKQFQQSLEDHHCLVICRQDADSMVPIGYMVVATVVDQAEILNIAIDPTYQGQSLGSHLLNHGLQSLPTIIEEVLLDVRVSNFSAISLYFNYGFIEVGRRRDYYRTEFGREDAILMTLQRAAVDLV
ncbi:ribosomal-protein-alanine N-acetyltransferase [Gammaproteobacteria bacterium MOLA455]|nr:ribosomal-protein-alanine N-acetyltransferase [Gammaproteobacteria bacterium MOLA455]